MLVKDRMTINDTFFLDNLLDMLVLRVVHLAHRHFVTREFVRTQSEMLSNVFRTLTKINKCSRNDAFKIRLIQTRTIVRTKVNRKIRVTRYSSVVVIVLSLIDFVYEF